MIAYTSGTTGNPKGVMLSHRNMIATAESFVEVNDVKQGDNWLSYLPMAWVGDAAFTFGMALMARLIANCPENPETVQRDLRELGPDTMLAPLAASGRTCSPSCRSRQAMPHRSSGVSTSYFVAWPNVAN